MTGEEWKAARCVLRVKLRQTRRQLGELRPAIFYVLVTAIFVFAYVATTAQGRHQSDQGGDGAAAKQGAHGPRAGEDPNDRIADYTLGLEWFTGALAVFSAIEIFVLIRTEDAMRRSLEIARRQMLLTRLQADIIDKQHAVGRQDYFATHRPQLVVREVGIFRTTPIAVVQLIIANVGASPARIVESAAELRLGDVLIGIDPLPNQNQVGDVVIEAGSTHRHEVRSDTLKLLDFMLAAEKIDPESWHRGEAVILRGYLVYSDDVTQVRRRTAFWRVYDPKRGRFSATDDPDFEYAD